MSETSIAIIGIAGVFPGASDHYKLSKLLQSADSAIRKLNRDDLACCDYKKYANSNYKPFHGCIDNQNSFDYDYFNLNKREARIIPPQNRKLLEICVHALEDAAYKSNDVPERTSIFVGSSTNDYLSYLKSEEEITNDYSEFEIEIANAKDQLAMLVAYNLNIKGPAITIQTACSTSLVAVHYAMQSLLTGESDMALAGGISIPFYQPKGYLYKEGMNFSKDGCLRAFDETATGLVPGSGGGIVVLKRLSDARDQGDKIDAVILSSAVNNDGHGKSTYTAPGLNGHTSVICDAIDLSGVNPERLQFIEAHGSGTILGDPIEFTALKNAIKEHTNKENFCALSSIKSNIGHLDVASGVAGLIKSVLQIKNKLIYPVANFEKINNHIDIENSPFYMPLTKKSLMEEDVIYSGISSLGIGGTNCHMILSSANQSSNNKKVLARNHAIHISAPSDLVLQDYCVELLEYISNNGTRLCDVASTLNKRFDQRHDAYILLNVSSIDELITSLNEYIQHGTTARENERYSLPDEFSGEIISLPLIPFKKTEINIRKDKRKAQSSQKTGRTSPLATMWEELLEVEAIKLSDSFNMLGGSSLAAIELVDKVNGAFGLNLPYDWVSRHDTLEEQIEELNKIDTYNPIREFGSNKKKLLILFHASISHANVYDHLSSLIDKDIDIIYVNSYNLDNSSKSIDCIDRLTEYYYSKLKNIINANKEIYLAGWSLGGIISLNIAPYFNRDNIKVKHIFLFDSIKYADNTKVFFKDEHSIYFRPDISEISQNLSVNSNYSKAIEKLIQIEANMCIKYNAPLIEEKTTLFIAEKAIESDLEMPVPLKLQFHELRQDNGWGDSLKNNEIIRLNCDHYSIMNNTNISKIASIISDKLNS